MSEQLALMHSSGPGEYFKSLDQPDIHGPAFTIQGKGHTHKAETKNTPGPGEYEQKESQGISFSIAAKPAERHEQSFETPGPGMVHDTC